MKRISFKNISFILPIMAIVLFGSCDRDKNNPGYIYYPDMTNSRAYESFSENPVLEGGHTMLAPVEGTVSREMVPYHLTNSEEDRSLAGKELTFPFEKNESGLARGKRMYEIFCIDCHGEKGDGKGILYTSGRYPYPPASIISEKIQENPMGEIYHVITIGWGVMGAHGSQIKPDDRWHIANYVQQSLGDIK